jgi:hypothetical protein
MSHSLRQRFGDYGVQRLHAARPRSLGLPIVPTPESLRLALHATGEGDYYQGQSQNTMPGNMKRASGLPGSDRAPKVTVGDDGMANVSKQAERRNPQGRPKGY